MLSGGCFLAALKKEGSLRHTLLALLFSFTLSAPPLCAHPSLPKIHHDSASYPKDTLSPCPPGALPQTTRLPSASSSSPPSASLSPPPPTSPPSSHPTPPASPPTPLLSFPPPPPTSYSSSSSSSQHQQGSHRGMGVLNRRVDAGFWGCTKMLIVHLVNRHWTHFSTSLSHRCENSLTTTTTNPQRL